jgi:ribosomal protein S18 acetylase RimI-like enzyme
VRVAISDSVADRAGGARLLAVRPWSEVAGSPGASTELLKLVHEAGNPYGDWFFGGEAHALPAVGRWLERASSELHSGRISVLARGGRVAGMFLAVGGAELQICRKADTVAALVEAGEERPAFLSRMAAAARLFLPVPKDSLYLSRIAVAPRLRGQGLGRVLMTEFLRAGWRAGIGRFDLDVAADNEPAIRLYRSFGFRVEARRSAAGMRYLRMVLLEDWPQ